MIWSNNWPTKPGWYWFHGFTSAQAEACARNRPTNMRTYLVQVRQGGNSLLFVTEGRMIYRAEGAYGHWMPATLPNPPIKR